MKLGNNHTLGQIQRTEMTPATFTKLSYQSRSSLMHIQFSFSGGTAVNNLPATPQEHGGGDCAGVWLRGATPHPR